MPPTDSYSLSPALLAQVPANRLLEWQRKGSTAQRKEAIAELRRRFSTDN